MINAMNDLLFEVASDPASSSAHAAQRDGGAGSPATCATIRNCRPAWARWVEGSGGASDGGGCGRRQGWERVQGGVAARLRITRTGDCGHGWSSALTNLGAGLLREPGVRAALNARLRSLLVELADAARRGRGQARFGNDPARGIPRPSLTSSNPMSGATSNISGSMAP